MSSHHITTATLRNGHHVGRAHSSHPCKRMGLLPQEAAAHVEPRQLHQQSNMNFLHHKETFILEVSRGLEDSWRYQVFNTRNCSAVTETMTEAKRPFIMWDRQKNICTSEAVVLSKRLLSVAFSLPPFLIFSTVDHVQIAVTCETDQ